jgi:hypothetical protein
MDGSSTNHYIPSRIGLENQFVSLSQSIQALFRYVKENGGSFQHQESFIHLCNALVEHYNALESYHGQYADHMQTEIQRLKDKLFVKDCMINSLNQWTNEFAKAKGVELELITFMLRKIKNRPPHAAS